MPATCNKLGAVLLCNKQTMGHTSSGTVTSTFLLLCWPGTVVCASAMCCAQMTGLGYAVQPAQTLKYNKRM